MFETEKNLVSGKIVQYCRMHDLPEPTVQWNWIPFAGHWGISTSFFQLASEEARLKGIKVNVSQRAKELAEAAKLFLGEPAGFTRVESVNGYLNLYFDAGTYSRKVLDAVNQQGEHYGWDEPKPEKVMVEYSQPNTHKAFHVGHLRNVILGNAICNLLEAGGSSVIRANYLGDIGLHVIKWLWNYQKFHLGEQPSKDKVRWMGDLYAEADQRYQDPGVQEEVKRLFARWDQQDQELISLWKKTRSWSMEAFDQVYELLGVRFDRIYFESEMEEPGKVLVEELIDRKIARDERPEGAVIIPLDEILNLKEKYRVLVILRSDGTSLYSTKDLPLAIQKFEEYHLDRSVYVIDVRQSLYLQQIFKTLEIMGFRWATLCHHLAYEIVNLPGNVTMSSRDGTVVLLEDLIREAVNRALNIVKEKNPELSASKQNEVSRAVALGAIKYSMLARENTKIVTFDWNSALDLNGQAAPYIQYAAVRANSILKKYQHPLPILDESQPLELTKTETELVEMISRLPREIQKAAAEYRPLYIANLAFELARAFNDFYNQCPVLTAEPINKTFRLHLVAAARQTIMNSLALLGIDTPDVM